MNTTRKQALAEILGAISLSGLSMTFRQRMFGKPLGKSLV